MNFRIFFYFIVILFGCSPKQEVKFSLSPDELKQADNFPFKVHVKYAKGFRVFYHNYFKKVEILNPWDSTAVLATYLLYNNEAPIPPIKEGEIAIPIPLNNVICQSTTHLPMFNILGLQDKVIGIPYPKLVKNEISVNRIKEGKIHDVSGSEELDVEKILNLQPDAVFVYPVKGKKYDKLSDVGLKLIYDAEYLETTPLGEAEWVKFISLFYNKEDVATAYFNDVEKKYLYYKNFVKIVLTPKVMAGNTSSGIFYAPAGNSYMANLIKDAGGKYVWYNIPGTAARQMDMEKVIEAGSMAKFWVMYTDCSGACSLDKIKKADERYALMQPVKTGNVIVCDVSKVNYFEDAVIQPQKLLADLIYCFHPVVLPDYTPEYYHKLEN